MASKKRGTIRQLAESADSPIDFVSAAGSVRVMKNFISRLKFTRIDFGGLLQSCPGCRRQLTKPSVLGAGLILKVRALGYFLVPKNLRM
jgi:hypothetical protein